MNEATISYNLVDWNCINPRLKFDFLLWVMKNTCKPLQISGDSFFPFFTAPGAWLHLDNAYDNIYKLKNLFLFKSKTLF